MPEYDTRNTIKQCRNSLKFYIISIPILTFDIIEAITPPKFSWVLFNVDLRPRKCSHFHIDSDKKIKVPWSCWWEHWNGNWSAWTGLIAFAVLAREWWFSLWCCICDDCWLSALRLREAWLAVALWATAWIWNDSSNWSWTTRLNDFLWMAIAALSTTAWIRHNYWGCSTGLNDFFGAWAEARFWTTAWVRYNYWGWSSWLNNLFRARAEAGFGATAWVWYNYWSWSAWLNNFFGARAEAGFTTSWINSKWNRAARFEMFFGMAAKAFGAIAATGWINNWNLSTFIGWRWCFAECWWACVSAANNWNYYSAAVIAWL